MTCKDKASYRSSPPSMWRVDMWGTKDPTVKNRGWIRSSVDTWERYRQTHRHTHTTRRDTYTQHEKPKRSPKSLAIYDSVSLFRQFLPISPGNLDLSRQSLPALLLSRQSLPTLSLSRQSLLLKAISTYLSRQSLHTLSIHTLNLYIRLCLCLYTLWISTATVYILILCLYILWIFTYSYSVSTYTHTRSMSMYNLYILCLYILWISAYCDSRDSEYVETQYEYVDSEYVETERKTGFARIALPISQGILQHTYRFLKAISTYSVSSKAISTHDSVSLIFVSLKAISTYSVSFKAISTQGNLYMRLCLSHLFHCPSPVSLSPHHLYTYASVPLTYVAIPTVSRSLSCERDRDVGWSGRDAHT